MSNSGGYSNYGNNANGNGNGNGGSMSNSRIMEELNMKKRQQELYGLGLEIQRQTQ